MKPVSKIIVPLDVDTLEAAEGLADRLEDQVAMFKVGHQLFTAQGPEAVRRLQCRGTAVFLDLKFHDIPNTVRGAVGAATRLGVRMLNVHTSGGEVMMRAAREAAQAASERFQVPRPWVVGVTVLTSHSEEDMQRIFGTDRTLRDQVKLLAEQAQRAGLDGVVASPHEITLIRETCGPEFLIVTPGIRPSWAARHDQQRVMTPREAVQAGADYLVIGRPISQATDPRVAVERILQEIAA